MRLTEYKDDSSGISFKVYDDSNILIGWIHYLKIVEEWRYSLSGPVGTHARVQELAITWLLEKELGL